MKYLDSSQLVHIAISVPEAADTIIRYIEEGVPTGSFLELIISNDFVHAAGCADETNQRLLFEYASVLYNDFPGGAWGSRQAYSDWINQHQAVRDAQREGR